MRQLSDDEWVDWKVHPVTKRLLEFLHEWREEVKEQWANEAFVAEPRRNDFALALVRALAQVINLKVEDLNEREEEHEWPGAPGPSGAGAGLHS